MHGSTMTGHKIKRDEQYFDEGQVCCRTQGVNVLRRPKSHLLYGEDMAAVPSLN